MLDVSKREEGVMALHLPTGPLKTRSGYEPVPRCEPRTYKTNSRWHSLCAIGVGFLEYSNPILYTSINVERAYARDQSVALG